MPYSNIKPVWHLQTNYTCHNPGGTNTSGVQDGGTFENPNAAPTTAPTVTCPSGSYVISWHTHISGPDGVHALLNWDAPIALTDPSGTYASCLKLAGGADCTLDRITSTQAGIPDTCTWGTFSVTLSDCDFQAVLESWSDRERIQGYGEFLPTVDASGELFLDVDQCLAMATADDCKTLPIFLPGSDVFEADQHDAYAIIAGAQPANLTYATAGERAPDGWYSSDPICTTKPSGTDCDEYPFLSTQQGGPEPHCALWSVPRTNEKDASWASSTRSATSTPMTGHSWSSPWKPPLVRRSGSRPRRGADRTRRE